MVPVKLQQHHRADTIHNLIVVSTFPISQEGTKGQLYGHQGNQAPTIGFLCAEQAENVATHSTCLLIRCPG
jgi:hypothetical protein